MLKQYITKEIGPHFDINAITETLIFDHCLKIRTFFQAL